MRLTRQTNYAIRILMYCAVNKDRLSRIPEIAAAYSVSELFLFKILQPLVENGFVETVRGRNGGVRLGRPADKITLFDVVRVTEEEWPDSSLGCPKPGQAYLQVITPGYRVVLGANGKEYEYHTDMASQVIACGR